ncbi:hypothetical protein CcI156_11445 [Frankia sp. CcI156]|uniref:Uncharacterized protein n=3 Tax=Frankiaceae TaxID=74712 RepID=Q2JG82_FRACC|nr:MULTISPECIES: hypothetical protein [unclassified Frankia]ABD09710.1 hypothetical protein Francci3_0323 [Frankia casuarinae]KDA43341.1 hypothetical protein BMG523Draft_01842 [Frankia sp. BMG5.23]OFB43186.1 hypothetical protein Manayef4_12945 [Frankia sp. CgIM4]ORT49917.1 hypothetical protein KBI5_13820 [Frankia sp. KB5]TFE30288.1 hypothetical protein E0F15_11795 [Frankia sp. B2]
MGGGGGEDEGHPRSCRLWAAFRGSFLGPEALPVGMWRIRSPDVATAHPADQPIPGDGTNPEADGREIQAVHRGHAIWLGTPDADLYRLDDSRWLLRNNRRAAALTRRLVARARPVTDGTAGSAHLHLVTGDSLAGYLQIIRLGPVVARLRTIPGEGSSLPRTVAVDLGKQAAEQVAGLAAAMGDLRRAPWRPSRWITRTDR